MPAIFTPARPGNPTAEVDRRPVLLAGALAVVLATGVVALFGGTSSGTDADAPTATPAVGAALVDRGPELGTASSPREPVVGAGTVDRGPELGTVGPQATDSHVTRGSVGGR